MSPREERESMWVKALALYAAYWPGRATLTGPTILAMEEAGLSRHDCDAVLVAVRIAGRTSEHPPTLAELLKLLEGETRRVPIYVTDLYGTVRLANDGAPLVKGWKSEQSEPTAYVERRRGKGLAPSTLPALASRPPENLGRLEQNWKPGSVLHPETIKMPPERLRKSSTGKEALLGRVVTQPPRPGRVHEEWKPNDGCWACGYRRNEPGVAFCDHCERPLNREKR